MTTTQRADLQAEVASWLTATWRVELRLRDWWAILAESGWGYPTWPREWFGRGLSAEDAATVRAEFAAAGALGPPHSIGQTLGAPVVMEFGTEEQKARFLPPLAKGLEAWCQFFSEPNAGSDLASVQTRAVRDGEEWVVNGEKVWNSGTLEADRGLLVARTDIDQPKHQGLSFFVIDIDQPGIDVRPIRQLNGQPEFNQTFFTNARVSTANLIGGLNNGWAVALATLTYERTSYSGGEARLPTALPGVKAGQLDATVGEMLALAASSDEDNANAFPLGSAPAMIALAREFGVERDPLIRQRIAKLFALAETARITGLRAQAAARAGRPPGPESSLGYLAGVRLVRLTRDLGLQILGPYATLDGADAPRDGAVQMMALGSLRHGIQGGTEQIQRNIIGERVLGLPREPTVDRGVPFRDLKVGTQRG
ncbi:MAG TPA: acyl-CoA dehydrogenase family protein [Acidimicrobiales bacterium]|nr:acyl-CoA dehydrogenase family protein [Acidimicrobiales bacterium]